MRVAIVPDKFKGTLTAPEAAAAIEAGWRAVRPKDQLECIPMSDGGDGFGETLAIQAQGERRRAKTINAAGEPIWAPWWWLPKSRTAIVETARVVGLAQLPKGKFHPFELDTVGLGILLKKVEAVGPKSCLIGLGGSATNDGGFGMARALGWRFLDSKERPIQSWTKLTQLDEVVPASPLQKSVDYVVAVDVQNRLLGKEGASRIYGSQKGLRAKDMPSAEANLKSLAQGVKRATGDDHARTPGAGAAGGLGFGCYAFLGGKAQSGFDLFAERSKLLRRLGRADLVITGEGSIDLSSLMGKGVGRVAEWCQSEGIPCIGLGGAIVRRNKVSLSFQALYSTVENAGSEASALANPKRHLRQIARRAAQEWSVDY